MTHQPQNWQAFESQLRDRLFRVDSPLKLADTPDFPLAFNADTSDRLKFTNANLSIRFESFAVSGFDDVHLDLSNCKRDGKQTRVSLKWGAMSVSGKYVVSAKEISEIALDTAGSMLNFDDNDDRHIQPGGADGVTPLDPTTADAMIDQAREQKKRLMDTPNGQKLLEQFNEHNEIYNTVFVASGTARRTWAANGATKDMAVDTHEALPSDKEVNPEGKTYGEDGVTYNQNSFRQQINIVTNSILADPNANLLAPPDPDSPYTKASLAALTFGHGVEETGNSATKTKPMKGSDVIGAVDKGSAPKEASVAELQNAMAQGMQDGGEAAEFAKSKNWRILTEEERQLVRRCHFEAVMRRIEEQEVETATLWAGECHASFEGATATIQMIEEENETTIRSIQVTLPAFEFDLDDSFWEGQAAEVVRQRLAEISFVRSLLHQRIQSGLADMVREVC